MKQFKPMLAGKVEPDKLKFPVLASPKIDGVRCVIKDGVALSRSLKPIPNKFIQSIIGDRTYNGFDGELVVGNLLDKDLYRNTVSGVMREDGEPKFRFLVFDNFNNPHIPYIDRYNSLPISEENDYINPLSASMINTAEELETYEISKLNIGYEGVMVRDPNGPYKFGRSSVKEGYLLKIKRFEDSEAVIIGFEELLHNDNVATTNELGRTARSSHKENMVPTNTLGAFIVVDVKTKIEFSIGTGFLAYDRIKFWEDRNVLVGKIVKYKYFATGSKDKPRFPVFLGFRDIIDL